MITESICFTKEEQALLTVTVILSFVLILLPTSVVGPSQQEEKKVYKEIIAEILQCEIKILHTFDFKVFKMEKTLKFLLLV